MVTIPASIIQGDTFRAQVSATASTVAFTLRAGGPAIIINATATGDQWTATAATEAWEPGVYAVEIWGTNVVECGVTYAKRLVARTRFTVEASAVTGGAAFSPLNQYEKIIQAIESHMAAGGQDPTWRRYKINNREIERYDAGELLKLLGHYKRLAAIERRKQKGQCVLGPSIRFRF